MAGIAGIDSQGREAQVAYFLDKLTHRGADGSKILSQAAATLGAVWSEVEKVPVSSELSEQVVWDDSPPSKLEPQALRQMRRPFALAAATAQGVFLARDPLGVCPLYYGYTDDGALCFASEVKALLEVTTGIKEFPPGTWYDSQSGFHVFAQILLHEPLQPAEPRAVAAALRARLERAVQRRIDGEIMGCWLSGGLDSSAIAALAHPHVRELHSFAVGVKGAPDLAYARQVADMLKTRHHQVVVTLDDLLATLPDVIYHLESFDALLVRSSVVNYLVARHAAEYVSSVFSGEGADELFAGYAYLKALDLTQLPAELVEITRRLHNTALQRVDRSAAAHGLVAHVPFVDPELVDYVLQIPVHLKLWRTDSLVEKWILRRALVDVLPDQVLWRGKVKFWQGAGIGEVLAEHIGTRISDADFSRERHLPNGWVLNTKEELAYYQIFREQFGELDNLMWMGRTKGAPTH
jgi:asparagine synthase (glutamine-hydrolysing)